MSDLVVQPVTWAYVGHRLIPRPQVAVTLLVLLGFFAAYGLNYMAKDTKALDLMNGALIAGFAGAWGYWLGSARIRGRGPGDRPAEPRDDRGELSRRGGRRVGLRGRVG